MKKEFMMFHLSGFAKNISGLSCPHEIDTTICSNPKGVHIQSVQLLTEDRIEAIKEKK